MQFFSFDFDNPDIELAGWNVSVQVITFENTYGLHRPDLSVDKATDRVTCNRLTWAGGQETAEGGVALEATETEYGTGFDLTAEHSEKIRCTKLVVEDLPPGTLLGRRWQDEAIDEDGTVLSYPTFQVPTPLLFLRADDEYVFFRSRDDEMRAKRFAVYERDGRTIFELIHEERADRMGRRVEVPTWEIGRIDDPRQIVDAQKAHVADAYDIAPWEKRTDMPDWTRDISLVVALHGMHWSGYVFNTYGEMREALQWLEERISPSNVLVYLPGWEGRYYWQYGDYGPAERLGGEEAFRRFTEYATETGFHLMPMFGVHCANEGSENFEQWGKPSRLTSAGGYPMQGNKPDWDVSRARDPGWQAWLNVGAAGWRNRLVDEVSTTVDEYDLDAVFFDTHHLWKNDPNNPMYEGLLELKEELHNRFPDLLITGEGWYDALGAITPVCHSAPPERYSDFFTDYNRRWGHLSYPDPSRGSTGVHETGYREFDLPDGPEEAFIPTLTVVDGTLREAPNRAEEVVDLAKAYNEEFL